MMMTRNNIALSGLRNLKRMQTQGYASLHPGLWVLRPFRAKDFFESEPRISLRYILGYGYIALSGQKFQVAERRCTISPRWSEAEPWVDRNNNFFQALKGRRTLAAIDKYQFQ